MRGKNINAEVEDDKINYKPIFIIIAILSILTTLYIDQKTPIDYRRIMRISVSSLFLGVIVENYRISKNWLHLFYLFFGTYFLSLTWFLFNKNVSMEYNVEKWPFYFIILFLIISVALYSEKITNKLTEGFTLLISIAFIYWLVEKNIFNLNNFVNSLLFILTVLFSGFSIFHSLSNIELTKNHKLILSIWTTIILLTMSLDNAFFVFKNTYNEYNHISDNLFLALKFFLFGISSVYTAQNLNMIYLLLDKQSRWKAKRVHVKRYSDIQVSVVDSIFCILFSVCIYFLNYHYSFLPKNLIIWSVIFIFPILIEFSKIIKFKNLKN